MAKSSTTFGKDNQPVKGRGKSERNKILDAMKRAGQDEDAFYDLLVTKATNPEDNFTFKELLSRLSPIPKAVAPLYKFDLPLDSKPHEKADYILVAIANGELPGDIGNICIQAIKSMIDIEEYTDLKERIIKLEAVLNGES
tara:strand:+ start:200 stop:622 length:423 start_codon:yes stop_codon:yes gene_type:complete